MSNAIRKNAARVWKSACSLSVGEGGFSVHWLTVQSVAFHCGMSKPTVRKYLEMAVEEQAADKWVAPSGVVMYRPIAGV